MPKTLPPRSKVKPADTWDLASLYPSDAAWEEAFKSWDKKIAGYEKFRGTLADGPAALAKCLRFDSEFDRLTERLGTYAFLRTTEDQADSHTQAMMGRLESAGARAAEAASFIRPEILAISAAKLKKLLAAKPLKPYKLMLERLVRYKPH
ncbi:MAG: oligoendopeptidase F, partial [Planctomycetota bacterium]